MGKKKTTKVPEAPDVVETPDVPEVPEPEAKEVPEVPEPEAKEIIPEGIIKVKAVIRPMHSPDDGLTIPDSHGVLIKEGSWATSQLKRGLLRIVE